jgi:uncharacterized RDD family membrane protein YckC
MQGPTQTNPCPRCSHKNTADSKYCANCNLHINGVCPRCAIHNPHSTHFCSNCGLDFAPASTQAFTVGPPTSFLRRIPALSHARPARLVVRILADLIDYAVSFALAALAIAIVADVPVIDYLFSDTVAADRTAEFISWGVLVAYAPTLLGIWSTTFGKRIFNTYVVRLDGSPVGLSRALARELSKYVLSIPLGVTYWPVFFRPDKRGLHDLIAGTIVITRSGSRSHVRRNLKEKSGL